MRVLFDVSVVGAGSQSELSRTGIYRVVDNLSAGLMRIPECKITLFCNPSYSWMIHKHFSRKDLGQVPKFCFTAWSAQFRNASRILSLARGRFGNESSTIYGKASRRLIHYADEVLDVIGTELNKFSFLRNNIYHSHYLTKAIDAENNKIRIFYTIYDLIQIFHPEVFPNEIVKSPVERFLRSLSERDYTLCISESTRKDLLYFNHRIDPNRCFVVPLAASDIFRPCTSPETIDRVKSKYGIPHDFIYVLSVCTLEPRKNLARLINSFFKVVVDQKISNLCLVLAGAIGWQYEDVLRKIERFSDSIKIISTGFIPDDDLAPLYSGAIAFAYPSLYEGFGLPVLEAMQCGTPVITSNSSSLPEVVADAGIMVNPKSEDEISEALLDLYRDENKRKFLSEMGIKRASQFSWEKSARATFRAYQTAMQS